MMNKATLLIACGLSIFACGGDDEGDAAESSLSPSNADTLIVTKSAPARGSGAAPGAKNSPTEPQGKGSIPGDRMPERMMAPPPRTAAPGMPTDDADDAKTPGDSEDTSNNAGVTDGGAVVGDAAGAPGTSTAVADAGSVTLDDADAGSDGRDAGPE